MHVRVEVIIGAQTLNCCVDCFLLVQKMFCLGDLTYIFNRQRFVTSEVCDIRSL